MYCTTRGNEKSTHRRVTQFLKLTARPIPFDENIGGTFVFPRGSWARGDNLCNKLGKRGKQEQRKKGRGNNISPLYFCGRTQDSSSSSSSSSVCFLCPFLLLLREREGFLTMKGMCGGQYIFGIMLAARRAEEARKKEGEGREEAQTVKWRGNSEYLGRGKMKKKRESLSVSLPFAYNIALKKKRTDPKIAASPRCNLGYWGA